MSEGPEVTIAIPVYNGGTFLRAAIESVLCQDFTDFELLVGDNASTDETPQLVEHYARLDSRVRHIRHSENIGGWNNFFYLLSNARGRFFSWLAHDDSYEKPDHICRLVEKVRQGYALAFPNVTETRYGSDGRVKWRRHNLLDSYRTANTRFRMSRIAVRCSAHPVFGLFRIETLRSYRPALDEDRVMIHYGEGRLVQKVIANERCVFVPEAVQNFSTGGNSAGTPDNVRKVLRDFLVYVWRSLRLYRGSRLTAGQRILLYGEILRVHLPNVALMAGVISKRAAMRAIRKVRRARKDV